MYVEVLAPRVTLFGDRAFKKVIKVNWGHKGGALIKQDWYLYKKRQRLQTALALFLSLIESRTKAM